VNIKGAAVDPETKTEIAPRRGLTANEQGYGVESEKILARDPASVPV
jgi:hypothetical protein